MSFAISHPASDGQNATHIRTGRQTNFGQHDAVDLGSESPRPHGTADRLTNADVRGGAGVAEVEPEAFAKNIRLRLAGRSLRTGAWSQE
jgi:hypothetical protein